MHHSRRGLQRKFLPRPKPYIEGSCGQYPRHELEVARRTLITQLQRANPALERIKPKLGILPDDRRFIYVNQNDPQAGKLGNEPWTSANGCVYNGPEKRNVYFAPPREAPEAKSEVTAGEKRNLEATGSASEQPQSKKMKEEGKNESAKSAKPEVVNSAPQEMTVSSAPPENAPEATSAAKAEGKRTCQATKGDSEQPQVKKRKEEGMSESAKSTHLGMFFKCDLCGLANSSSNYMSKHLKESGHRTASKFQGKIEPQFQALQLLKPMALTCHCKDHFGSRVPTCKMCGVRFDNVFSCLGHMTVSHKVQNLSYHVRRVEKTTTEVIKVDKARPVCKVCQKRTDSLVGLSNHCTSSCHFLNDLLKAGPDVFFACKMKSCQKLFGHLSQLMSHLPQHGSDVPEYSFVWAQLRDGSKLRLLDTDVDSESRVDLESLFCSHLALFYEKSSCAAKDRKNKRKNLEKYQQLLEEKKKDFEDQREEEKKDIKDQREEKKDIEDQREAKKDIEDQEEEQIQPRGLTLKSVCSMA